MSSARKKYNDELAQERNKIQDRLGVLETQKAELDLEKLQLDVKVTTAIQDGIAAEKQRLRDTIKTGLVAEQSGKVELIRQELAEKIAQLKSFNKIEAENERLKREKDELKDTLEAEAVKNLTSG